MSSHVAVRLQCTPLSKCANYARPNVTSCLLCVYLQVRSSSCVDTHIHKWCCVTRGSACKRCHVKMHKVTQGKYQVRFPVKALKNKSFYCWAWMSIQTLIQAHEVELGSYFERSSFIVRLQCFLCALSNLSCRNSDTLWWKWATFPISPPAERVTTRSGWNIEQTRLCIIFSKKEKAACTHIDSVYNKNFFFFFLSYLYKHILFALLYTFICSF